MAVLAHGLDGSKDGADEDGEPSDEEGVFNSGLQKKLRYQRWFFIVGFLIIIIAAFSSELSRSVWGVSLDQIWR